MSAGSIIVLNTSSRGASKTRVSSASRSEMSVTFSSFLAVATMIVLPLSFLSLQELVQTVEALLPELAVALHPCFRLLQREGVQPGGAVLRVAAALDELQVLRDGGEADVERARDLAHGGLALRQAREDRAPRRVRERSEGQAESVRLGGH